MRERVVEWARGYGFVNLALSAIAAGLILWVGYTVIYRLFLAPGEAKKAEATVVVANEQVVAEETITTETLDTMREREVVRSDVQTKVNRGGTELMLKLGGRHQPARRTTTFASMMLASLLCASCTTVSAEMPDPRRCSRYTAPFLEETPHAEKPKPGLKSWTGFAIAQTGQLVIANDDKRKARHVQQTCEDETTKAFERARRKLLPWYKKIL